MNESRTEMNDRQVLPMMLQEFRARWSLQTQQLRSNCWFAPRYCFGASRLGLLKIVKKQTGAMVISLPFHDLWLPSSSAFLWMPSGGNIATEYVARVLPLPPNTPCCCCNDYGSKATIGCLKRQEQTLLSPPFASHQPELHWHRSSSKSANTTTTSILLPISIIMLLQLLT